MRSPAYYVTLLLLAFTSEATFAADAGLGIDQARRAWLTANDALNTRPLAELRKLLTR
jgi:hypothetical protein